LNFVKKIGNKIKNNSEGMTNQKIFHERFAIFEISWVSLYSQIIAIIDVKGKEAIKAPKAVNLFEASDMANINNAEITILIKYLKKNPPLFSVYFILTFCFRFIK
jgi:hypothetical protein